MVLKTAVDSGRVVINRYDEDELIDTCGDLLGEYAFGRFVKDAVIIPIEPASDVASLVCRNADVSDVTCTPGDGIRVEVDGVDSN